MAKKVLSYDDENIQKLSDSEWILLRPHNHIRDTDETGQIHIIKEIFDNSMDETELHPGGQIDVLFFLDKKKCDWQVVIRDNGRGVPLGKLKESFSELKTSGKYNKESYAGLSSGLNGCGSCVAMALSENFKVVTFRENQIGHLVFFRSDLVSDTIEPYLSETTGTMVALSPRKGFFTNVDVFVDSAYEQLIKLILLLSMFSKNTHIVTRVVHRSIDSNFWSMNGAEALDFIDWKYRDDAIVLTDGANNEMVMKYLKELWSVDSKFIWSLEKISDLYRSGDTILEYNFSMFLPKIFRGTYVTSIVNNVPIKDNNSSHITGLVSVIKEILVNYIDTPELRLYFMEFYKLPLCFAISVKYSDVKFTSLAKDGFRSSPFEALYMDLVRKSFETINPDFWALLYAEISQDINVRYHQYYNKPLISKKEAKTLSLEIDDMKFYDCSTSDRSSAELIIVEGVSASHVRAARDPERQAVYMIRGKPLNVNKTDKNRQDSFSRLKSYPAYDRLMKILNIQPGQTDISTAHYGKIILMQDADVDGGHIRALHIGALHEINPLILESGMVYLANPPLYEVMLDEKSDKKKFIRSKHDLIQFRIDCIYRPTLTIKLTGNAEGSGVTTLKNSAFSDFCAIITTIGEMFMELSSRLVIPPLILEKLTHITPYIQTGKVDSQVLRQVFGRGTFYSSSLNILTIADHDNDVSFSLDGVVDALYDELMGILHKIGWKKLKILASTNFSDALCDTHVSIVQLYQIFDRLNNKLYVQRHKGLGGMNEEDLRTTCVNPNTRYLHQVTSIGDFQKILALLGDDATARRQILEYYGLMDPKKI